MFGTVCGNVYVKRACDVTDFFQEFIRPTAKRAAGNVRLINQRKKLFAFRGHTLFRANKHLGQVRGEGIAVCGDCG